jgi:acetoin:2,6-dichlorophenolindophenol oxidoreductase subunit alpha
MNMASLWQVPLLVVVENNRYAQTTNLERACAGDMAARFAAFGVDVLECQSNDLIELYSLCGDAVAQVRKTVRPRALILHTYRLNAHMVTGTPICSLYMYENLDPAAPHRATSPNFLVD